MKKKLLQLVLLLVFFKAYTQVGINTPSPAATLDINAKNATGTSTSVEGILIPRIDRQKAQSMAGIPTSILIYVNSTATGSQTGTAVNIDTVGYYYYDGTTWLKLHNPTNSTVGNIYNTDGTLTGNRIVSQGNSTLAFTGTATNAFSVDNTTLSVDAANNLVGIGTITPDTKLTINTPDGSFGLNHTNGTINLKTYIGGGSSYFGTTTANNLYLMSNNTIRMAVTSDGNIGVGTSTPDTSALLDISDSNKGFLLPRISLTSITDASTIVSPAKGLLVYNINPGLTPYGEGIYYNEGTTVSANWRRLSPQTTDYQLAGIFIDAATAPVDQAALGSGVVVNDINLGLSTPITIPANSEAKISVDYSIPVGTTNTVGSESGYYGIRFLKNGVEEPLGSRKYTIPEGDNGSQMVSVGGKFGETIVNSSSSPITVTYTLNGYAESNNHAIRFNMWSTSGNNFNWGKGSMAVTVFVK
ncbi:hypothetical protein WH221_19185 [Chryseobacterium culicis]|uniref:Uncharacterized protein n=1 Tax=Chryseobacterium culicis TaxID=680127 RepID=A0A2S9CMQ1_CHRCI|nr:hypothetical protein [Chryseobacterium culicis]PRB81792.1 hypothetical protein CQ022_19155 [Chryseobacterium culicis]PRB88447.1 hypothetical protein CQ033_18060 [Chryseobacterium culicis]